jgi:hypothetical protein
MAVPSILVAVIAMGVLEKARCWELYLREKGGEGAVQVGGLRADRCRIRPRDFELCLAATTDEAEPPRKGLKGRGTVVIPFANSDD